MTNYNFTTINTLETHFALTALHIMFPVCVSPARCVDGFLVWRRHGETHRGDHGFVPRRTDHLPLGPLRVILEHTLLASAYRDLRGGRTDAETEKQRGTDGAQKKEKRGDGVKNNKQKKNREDYVKMENKMESKRINRKSGINDMRLEDGWSREREMRKKAKGGR